MFEVDVEEYTAVANRHVWSLEEDDGSEWYVVAELPVPDNDLSPEQAVRYRTYVEAVRRAQQASRETHTVYAIYEQIDGELDLIVLVYEEKLFAESGA